MTAPLIELARAWRRRGVRWTLLRKPGSGDVDVLVAAEDWPTLRQVAIDEGFVALPGWDSQRNLILVRYDRPSDRWCVLDVVTSLAFRSAPAWSSARLAEQVLTARREIDGMAMPSSGDAFWLLLLHCLLDKGRVEARYRGELTELASAAGESSLGGALAGHGAAELASAARAGDWDALAGLGDRLARELQRRAGMRRRVQTVAEGAVTTLRRPLLLRRRRGVNLALLGPNGVGKSALAAGLAGSFPFDARVVYMGVWKNAGGGLARRAGEVATRPARLLAAYLAGYRHVLLGRLLVFDRYASEAALPAAPPLRTLKAAYFWLLRRVVPPPQRTVILDVAGEVAYGRKQENPPDELERERRFYAALAPSLRRAQVIDASRPAQAVRADVMELVWRDLARRWSKAA